MLSPADWESILRDSLDKHVTVRFGRARTQPVHATFEYASGRGSVHLRLHEFFREAPAGLVEDLAAWLRAGRRARRASERLDAWIDAQLAALPSRAPRVEIARARGHVHDLDPMAGSLFEREFADDFCDQPRPQWTWGKRGRSRARRSIQLGCYVREAHLVRIHPVLDQAAVPEWFVRFVLFHEILHAALPCERNPHGPAFRARERAHPDYRAAVSWQRRHLDSLIRSARRGEPMRAGPVVGVPARNPVQGVFFPTR